jgi:hypothetical protein
MYCYYYYSLNNKLPTIFSNQGPMIDSWTLQSIVQFFKNKHKMIWSDWISIIQGKRKKQNKQVWKFVRFFSFFFFFFFIFQPQSLIIISFCLGIKDPNSILHILCTKRLVNCSLSIGSKYSHYGRHNEMNNKSNWVNFLVNKMNLLFCPNYLHYDIILNSNPVHFIIISNFMIVDTF